MSDEPAKPDSDAEPEDGDIYELAEPDEPEPASSTRPLRPELMPDAAEPPGEDHRTPAPSAESPSQPPTEEPAFVDPAVAASRREQQRVRAAELATLEDERRRKRNLILLGVIVALAALAGTVWFFLA